MSDFEKIITLGDGEFLGAGENRTVPLIECRGVLEVDDRLSRGQVKTAAAEDALAEAHKISPVAGRVYILVIGLGSSEFWGVNNNGDEFPENALLGLPPQRTPMTFFDKYSHRLPREWGYKTFLKAHVFEEHRNSNPKLAIGGIHSTHWNNRMHRVENLIWVDRNKGKKWADRADRGEVVSTSMACKVPFDACSACGNLAPTKAQYCRHIRPGTADYQLRQIRADGKAVSMINDFPSFFDESCVENPAAPEALSIMKVASDQQKVAQKKTAEIEKQDADLPLDVSLDDLNGLTQGEQSLPDSVLDRLAPLGMSNAIKGASELGICFKPSEIFAMYFDHPVKSAAAFDSKVLSIEPQDFDLAQLDDMGLTRKHGTLDLAGVTDAVKVARAVSLLKPFAMSRSYDEPYLTIRLMKSASCPAIKESYSTIDERMMSIYHSIYKAASGDYGYGIKQAKMAWNGRYGDY